MAARNIPVNWLVLNRPVARGTTGNSQFSARSHMLHDRVNSINVIVPPLS